MPTPVSSTAQVVLQNPFSFHPVIVFGWTLDATKSYTFTLLAGTKDGLKPVYTYKLPPGSPAFGFSLDVTLGLAPQLTEG